MNYVIKIGGSLIPDHVKLICNKISKTLSAHSSKIFLFPGGGEFANIIRKYRNSLNLNDLTTHKMALACLDQNAYIIAQLCGCAYSADINKMNSLKGNPIVITPYKFLLSKQPFKQYNLNIDKFSSDSSAAFIAHKLNSHLIIATDVDGVFKSDPKKKKTMLLKTISSKQLKEINRGGPLDTTFADLISKYKLKAWVVNGKYPSRICGIIKTGKLRTGTFIYPEG